MNGEGSETAEARQTGQCDRDTGSRAGRSHELGLTEAWREGLGLWAPSNPSPDHFSTLPHPTALAVALGSLPNLSGPQFLSLLKEG